jgi:cytochrome c1
MFDAFKQAKLQNGYQSMKEYKPAPEKDMSLEELKRLSGNGKITGETTVTPNSALATQKAQYMRENNIRPGDKEWFKLWFAQPHITGEDPFSKN